MVWYGMVYIYCAKFEYILGILSGSCGVFDVGDAVDG